VSGRVRRISALSAILLAAGVCAWWIIRIGDRLPGFPPTGSVSELESWVIDHGADGVAAAVIRLVALGASVWLVTGAACLLVAELRPGRALDLLARRVAPRALRHAVHGLAGVAVVAVAVSSSATPSLAAPLSSEQDPLPEPGTATLRPLPPDGAPPADEQPTETPPPSPEPPQPDPDPEDPAPASEPAEQAAPEDRWVVEPGDSCWQIAAEVLADAWQRPPTDAEIVPYWLDLIHVNGDRFVTGDPDLIHPGQELLLPPTPG
jgi:hypothetical protein